MSRLGANREAPTLLHQFFEAAAARWGEEIAIDVPPGRNRPARTTTSYRQLAREAERLSAHLRPHASRDAVVAIFLPRDSARVYAAQLAVHAAGLAFVCPDLAFPDAHLRYVLEDSRAVLVLTDAAGATRLRACGVDPARLLDVDALPDAVPSTPQSAAARLASPHDLAYLIYTSGTTGKPKGVMLEHRGIANLVAADLREFGLGPKDRVAQGSSSAYDSSLEETWLALASGATVVVMDDEAARLGPDLVAWLRDERITVLCPPPTQLRTTGCDEPWRELPDLRLIYAGGEALPQDLADRWSRDRRFVNGYGPTECTVTVVRGEVRPGEAVAIGTPVQGHVAHVLGPDLEPVPEGQSGELCIAGVGVARGYLGRDDLSAERFVQHPRFGRIYRTGDRVRRAHDGRLFYEGRLDAQVKLRGYRIELEEIEARLAACDGVREAACRVLGQDGNATLAAYVVASDGARLPGFERLAERLRAELPAYMVPSRFAQLDALPTTVGGKLDRKALPEIEAKPATNGVHRAAIAPRDGAERAIAAAFARALGRSDPLPLDGDFFELGGDSVRAALLVSRLRDDPATAQLTVRDVYDARTIEGLAARARARSEAQHTRARRAPRARSPESRPVLVTLAQALWLALGVGAAAAITYAAAFVALPWALDWIEPITLLLLAPLFGFAALAMQGVFGLAFAVAVKRALIGRYVAGRIPAWSWQHFRHWIVQHAVRAVPWSSIQGTVFQTLALRALGARIGTGVHLHRGVDLLCGGWDLLEIEDDVSVGQDASLGLVEMEDGHLVLGPITLRRGATLEVRAGVEANTIVEANGCLAALSCLPAGGHIRAGERWDGVPAHPAGRSAPPPQVTHPGERLGPLRHGLTLIATRGARSWLAGLPFLLLTIALLLAWDVDSARLQAWLTDPVFPVGKVAIVLAIVLVALPLGLVVQALLLRWTKRVAAGTLRTHSREHVRLMNRTHAIDAASEWLSGALLWPMWLRLAGMKLGADVEISTILDALPEQVRIGSRCFLADGIYLAGPRVDRGTVTVAPVAIGDDSFLGNHVVIPPGVTLPDGVLLGVCTVADQERMRPGSSWFGHPPFELPRREIVEVDRRLTHEPGAVRYLNRMLWELARLGLPIVPALALMAWIAVMSAAAHDVSGPWLWLGLAPAITLAFGLGFAVLVLAMKWALLGRVAAGQHALWSCWCSRWDFLYVAWGYLGRAVLEPLDGTLLLSAYLRLMGMRIGRRVVLGPGFAHVVDPDMLVLEDDCTVDTMFQAHSFEDRVLKIAPVRIGRGATVKRASVILYGADVGEHSEVAAHSVVMKNEELLAGQVYAGVPTRPA
ncbi:MAG: amino acid adenylation domain-containing protein [Planctomycetes bacterium]|nr:amino acid adenylation domain-containing protein [Planctomycetota bacterium]